MRLYQIFARDFRIHYYNIILLMLQAMIFTSVITFWLLAVDGTLPQGYAFSHPQRVVIYSCAGLSVLFGGIFVDVFLRKKYFFEIATGIAAFSMGLISYVPNLFINFIGALSLSGIGFFLGISFFTSAISKTTLLNRARTVSFILFFMLLFTSPIMVAINTTSSYGWAWCIPLSLGIVMLILNMKFPPRVQLGQIKDSDILSFRTYWQMIKKSNILSYLFFLFFTSLVLSFYLGMIAERSDEQGDLTIVLIIIAITGLLSFILIGATLDNLGRKPVIMLTLFLLGMITIFFGYPVNDVQTIIFNILQIAVFSFAGLLIVILTVVLAGDNASLFSRGRIMGIFLFATISGMILGMQFQYLFVNTATFSRIDMVKISAWTSAILFLSVIFISRVREPFNEDTPHWRDYLRKLYVISTNGVGLHAVDFEHLDKDRSTLNEDLVSGGLSGIQAMLKEIAQSQNNIKVLDFQGDLKMIFHHGQYSSAVLFVSKDLVVYREKLARFHEEFELFNKDLLQHFTGNVSKLKKVDLLTTRYLR